MSVGYRAISWNAQKKRYDIILAGGVALYLLAFIGFCALFNPDATGETILLRAFGTAAFLLLNIALAIGPLCRLDSRFLPLLYNRRHLGVTTFLLGLIHAGFFLVQFHTGGRNPLVDLLTSDTQFGSIPDFPFQILGFCALVILFLMAATSHDFWLCNLTAPTWKRLHMLVYLAYALLVAHVSLGALQSEQSTVLAAAVAFGFTTVIGLHLAAALRERRIDRAKHMSTSDGFVDVCAVDDIPPQHACVVSLHGERVAVFRYDEKISAVSNVCQHQNGPLGEGRIIDGCITCPWHGFQYLPENGAAPPPFREKVATFQVRVIDNRVCLHPQPNVPGTWVEPACIKRSKAKQEAR